MKSFVLLHVRPLQLCEADGGTLAVLETQDQFDAWTSNIPLIVPGNYDGRIANTYGSASQRPGVNDLLPPGSGG